MVDRIFAAMIGVAVCFSCGSGVSTSRESVNENTDSIEEAEEVALKGAPVKIVYDAPEALNAPAYTKEFKSMGPLGLLDSNNMTVTMVDIDDVGAFKENGKMNYTVWFYNPTEDTVQVAALLLPDRRYEADWNGWSKYIPKSMTGFRLMADSVEYVEDYRIVLKYVDDAYAPQVFHLNLHPDIIELRKAKGVN